MREVKRVLALSLSPTEKVALLFFVLNGGMADEGAAATQQELAHWADVTPRTAVTVAQSLEAEGLIVPTGKTRRGKSRFFRVVLT
jgi:DNA-binding MarR family transcriptional regulator